MDSPPTSVPAPPAIHRRAWIWILLAGLLLYGGFILHYLGAYAGGSDSSGYLNNARLLAEGRLTAPLRLLPGLDPASLPPYTQVPLGFVPNPDHRTMTPTYPMGLPLLLAAAARVAGWSLAPGLDMWLHVLLGVWLVYLLARTAGLEPGWAGLGGLLLAASPIYVNMSLQLMSDVPAMVWVSVAVLAAWYSRRRPAWALLAGLALSLAVLMRPSNLLVVVPAGLALGLSARRWLLLILGGLPGAIFLAVFNHAAYGHYVTTGYGDVATFFGLKFVVPSLAAYADWLPIMLTPLVILALGLPWVRRRRSLPSHLLGAWVLVFLVFYMFYRFTHEAWWYQRFLLPAYPPLVVSAVLVLRALLRRVAMPYRAVWVAAIVPTVIIQGAIWSRKLVAYRIGIGERVYPLVAEWTEHHLPPDAVVACMQTSGTLLYYTKFPLVRWDMISTADFQRIAAACAAHGRPLYAVLFPFEISDPAWQAFHRHLTGHWREVGAVRQVTIWRRDPSGASP